MRLSAYKSEQDGMVLLLLNLQRVLMQSLRRLNVSWNLFVARLLIMMWVTMKAFLE